MMHCKHKHIILFFLLAILSLSLNAQSREGVRKQMNQGNYSNAITLLNALEEIYPKQFTHDLQIAQKCLYLQNNAKKKFKVQHYTEAEELYNQILKLNPNDRDARQSIARCQRERDAFWSLEYSKCKTMEDYRSFAQRYPNAPQAKKAKAKVEEFDLPQQDYIAWLKASQTGTVASYTEYITKANFRASHLGEAYRNRARLQYQNAKSSSSYNEKHLFYLEAIKDYENAMSRDVHLWTWTEDYSIYNACIAEKKYFELGTSPDYYSVTSYLDWAIPFKSDKVVAPHLNLNIVYSMLVDAYCKSGKFEDARRVVDLYYGQMTSSFFSKDFSREWSKSEWKKYIRERGRLYKRSSYGKKSSPKDRVETMWSLGASFVLSGQDYDRYLGPNVSFSIGSFDNRFNWDFSVSPLLLTKKESDDTEKTKLLCPFTTGPRINIKKRDRGDFFLSIEPEVGYCIGASGVYGGKMIVGYDLFGVGIEALGSMETSPSGIKWGSNFIYIGFGANFYF